MRSHGYMLLELVLVMALIAATSGIVLFAGGRYLESRYADATRLEVENLALAVRAYYRDTGVFPAEFRDLVENVPVVAGWRGPYVSLDAQGANGGYLTDAWGQAYLYVPNGSASMIVRSSGQDGQNDGGGGDDVSKEVDVSDLFRAVTDREIREIDTAIRAYNLFSLPAAPLPSDYPSLLQTLKNQKYVPNDTRLDTDAWGNAYVPGGSPVQYVASSGAP
jgi:general secretion pathway protein G